MTTNTTKNVGPTHEHNFNAQGVCGCGLTFDQWRAQNEPQAEAKDSDGGAGAGSNQEPE